MSNFHELRTFTVLIAALNLRLVLPRPLDEVVTEK